MFFFIKVDVSNAMVNVIVWAIGHLETLKEVPNI